MPIINIICAICTEVFNNADDVYSTSCGHLFHLFCLNDWQQRQNSCPQCRLNYPTKHKVYLTFDESEENYEKPADLEIKIQSSEEKVAELSQQKEEIERHFLRLQNQFTNAEEIKVNHQERLNRMSNNENDFLLLQAQFTESSEAIKQLEGTINQLSVQNEHRMRNLNLKTRENEQINLNLGEEQVSLPENELGEKMKSIERRLKLMTEELEKEVNTSTKLSIENIKLQSYINNFHTAENNENCVSQQCKKSSSKKGNANKRTVAENDHQNRNGNANSVLIKGIPLREVTIPLENVVLKLASKMNISISKEDLVKINAKSDFDIYAMAQLLVQFSNSEIKKKFISNKKTLKNFEDMKTIFIEDLISDEMQSNSLC